MYARSMSSIIWFTCSVCPSIEDGMWCSCINVMKLYQCHDVTKARPLASLNYPSRVLEYAACWVCVMVIHLLNKTEFLEHVLNCYGQCSEICSDIIMWTNSSMCIRSLSDISAISIFVHDTAESSGAHTIGTYIQVGWDYCDVSLPLHKSFIKMCFLLSISNVAYH